MKKSILICVLFFMGVSVFAVEQKSVTEYYNASVQQIYPNKAKKIIMGNIDLLEEDISDLDLAAVSNADLRILRNIIYAKHGNIFSSKDLTDFYSNFKWYKPTKKVQDSELTPNEKKLLERIQIFEKRDENLPTEKIYNMTGVWQNYYYVASGWGDRFVFYTDSDKLDFLFSQMRYLPIANEYNGTYEVKGNVLIFYINQIQFNDYLPDYTTIGYVEMWEAKNNKNTMTFNKPIVLKFPIKNFELGKTITIHNSATNKDSEIIKDYIEMGSYSYYKMRNDPSQRY